MRAFNLNISSDIDLLLPPAVSGQYDVNIAQGIITLPTLEQTKIFRAGAQALYAFHHSGHFLVWPNMVALQITANNITYQKLGNIPIGLLRIFILSEAIGILLHLRGHFMLHASALEHQGQATVFLGTPGAGKSTTVTAFAKEGFNVLSDDLVAITPHSPATVIPAFPEIKIWKNTAEGLGIDVSSLSPAWEGKDKYIMKLKSSSSSTNTYPLKQFIIIIPFVEHNTNSSELIGPVELLKYFPLPHQLLNPSALKKHFEVSASILSTTALVTVQRPADFNKLSKYVQNFKNL
ncbi:hypothetical protein [Lacihabitans soyangensis]|uniref:Serine kinase n=1 Tax=Lacihabitans soyangensis TaxID=869394 RepID=A0AAE3H4T1_9BACT|nr:hypothetical protein [Lacihabitans soyangensis]MCP9764026.1 hypothetical protein [Lacihabitans soyangensis]